MEGKRGGVAIAISPIEGGAREGSGGGGYLAVSNLLTMRRF